MELLQWSKSKIPNTHVILMYYKLFEYTNRYKAMKLGASNIITKTDQS